MRTEGCGYETSPAPISSSSPAGRCVFWGVNVAPGMIETSTLPIGIEHGGLELGQVCHDLLHTALSR